MKIYDKIIQGTDEWKELRHGKVGGSTAKEIMSKYEKPITECAAFYTLLSEQMEDFDPFTNEFTSFSMQRGNELEPEARTEYERITGIEMAQFGWIEIDSFVGISPDGWNIKLKKAIEIKCPAANTYAKYLLNFDEFLSDYVWQLVHYFVVLGVDSVDCVGAFAGSTLANFSVSVKLPVCVLTSSGFAFKSILPIFNYLLIIIMGRRHFCTSTHHVNSHCW